MGNTQRLLFIAGNAIAAKGQHGQFSLGDGDAIFGGADDPFSALGSGAGADVGDIRCGSRLCENYFFTTETK